MSTKSPFSASQLLLSDDTTVTCPSCAVEFSLDQGFAKKALDQLSTESAIGIETLRETERAKVEARAQQIAAEQARDAQVETASLKKILQEQSASHAKSLTEVRALTEKSMTARFEEMQRNLAARDDEVEVLRGRESALTARENQLESRVKAAAQIQAEALLAHERQAFEEAVAAKDTQLSTLRDEQLQLRKERQQLRDATAEMELSLQKRAEMLVQQREVAVRTQEQEKASLKEADLHKTIADMRAQLVEAQRKADQGSQQAQGEVLELVIEDSLRRAFPMDNVEEVKKGQRGGDLLQHVMTRSGQPAGTILWEVKRAKDWSLQWIPKLKQDMRAGDAVVGVLVTTAEAVPKEWPPSSLFALHEEIWVTQASCAVSVAEALRIGLLDLHRQRAVSAGKGEKMEALYDYLTSPQFAQKLKAVYDTFKKMRDELESERSVTTQRWARREKQLQAGMQQLLGIGGEIQGIAQQDLPMLEMELDG
jgi:hypothetical protein